ncbi:MAG TPA: hypothetical protein VJC10_02655 [Patescibacteria group bacterium]|nr:hypothetical protein [Patescibacteria group bacterium]
MDNPDQVTGRIEEPPQKEINVIEGVDEALYDVAQEVPEGRWDRMRLWYAAKGLQPYIEEQREKDSPNNYDALGTASDELTTSLLRRLGVISPDESLETLKRSPSWKTRKPKHGAPYPSNVTGGTVIHPGKDFWYWEPLNTSIPGVGVIVTEIGRYYPDPDSPNQRYPTEEPGYIVHFSFDKSALNKAAEGGFASKFKEPPAYSPKS